MNNTPIKNLSIQDKQSQSFDFSDWIEELLSLDGEKSEKRLAVVLVAFKSSELSLNQIKAAFEMFISGKFPNVQPRDNYFTIVIFKQIVNYYQTEIRKKNDKVKEVESDIKKLTKEDYLKILEEEFNSVANGNIINSMRIYLYDYLYELDQLPKDNKIKDIIKKQVIDQFNKKQKSKIELPVNKSEHISNILDSKFSDQEVINKCKLISLERYLKKFISFNQLKNNLLKNKIQKL